jgi:hypothetical protein
MILLQEPPLLSLRDLNVSYIHFRMFIAHGLKALDSKIFADVIYGYLGDRLT